MSLSNIKGSVTQQKKDPTSSLLGLLNKPEMKNQLAMALPSHMKSDRMIRIATTEIRKVPKLAQCDQMSFIGAIVQCSQLGLEPGGALGHAYLIPFGNGKSATGQPNVQLIIGYRGLIDLARRSGQIVSISARVVRETDEFSYSYGLEEDLIHKPGDNDDSEITHVYAVAKLKDGGVQFEVMSRMQIEKVRQKHSKSASSGPWVDHWEEMARKTVIRRLFKYLPVSIEMQTAVSLDEKADAQIDQDNASIITGEYSVVETSPTESNLNVDTNTGEIVESVTQKEVKKEERTPEDLLGDFTKKLSTLDNLPAVEKCYAYIKAKLENHPNLLELATEAYSMHKMDLKNAVQDDEDIPM